jgi:UDP:flavonoid glycosyltransferase YjiC (YdhE family)
MAGRLAEALRSASWRVLWVLDERSRQLLPESLRVSDGRWRLESWVAQYDILSFEGVRCFVSHCGGNSSVEALSFGIPMVCMPFFCDQFDWASAIGNHAKAGIVVDKFESTSDDIRAALQSALEDSSVKSAALQVALDMRRELEEKQSMIVTHSNEEELPGVAVAANLILEMTAGKDPTRHFRTEQSQGVLSSIFSMCARRKND